MTHGSPIPTSSHHTRSDARGLWELTWAKRPEQCLAQDQTHPWVNPCTHRPSDTLGAPHSQNLKPPHQRGWSTPNSWPFLVRPFVTPPSPCHPSLLLHSWGHFLTQTLTLPSLSPLGLAAQSPPLKTPQACVLSDLPSPLVSLTTGGGAGGGGADERPAVGCSPGCPRASLPVSAPL